MRNLRLALAAFVTTAILGLPSLAFAINYGGIGAVPANPKPDNPRTQSIFIYSLTNGQSASDAIKVLNNTNQSQTVALDAVDSELASGGSFTCKQAVEAKSDVGAWIQLQSTTVTLAPNSTMIVPFTITVPASKSIGVGEHDGCLTIQAVSQTATSSTKSGILLSFRSAIRVVVTIPGKIVKKLDINKVSVSRTTSGKYAVAIVVNNVGNVSLDTKVQTSLQSIFGPSAQNTNNGVTPVLPHSVATLNYTLNRPFWGGWYQARAVTSYNQNPSSQLGVNNNSNQAVKSLNSAVFFSLPTPAGGAIEVSILLLILGAAYWLIRSRKQASHIKTHWSEYKVKKADTLESLAGEYGTTWRRIAKVNNLKPPYDLKKDQKLSLPSKKR